MFRTVTIAFTAAAGLALWSSPGQALTTKECSEKYQAAKSAGTLKGANWNQFRKTECGDSANPLKASAPAAAPAATSAPTSAATAASAAAAVFPKAVDPQFAKEKPAAQRMKTCLEQYNSNKASNGNGGLKWIQKGGGYYSECNKRLKGV